MLLLANPDKRFFNQRPPVKLRRTLPQMIADLEVKKQGTPAMPTEVTHLSGVMRAAKEALALVPNAAARMLTEANELKTAVVQVEALADEMKANTSELRGILATLNNGGPALAPGE